MNDHNVYHFNDDWWGEESLSSQKGGIGADVVGGFGDGFEWSKSVYHHFESAANHPQEAGDGITETGLCRQL